MRRRLILFLISIALIAWILYIVGFYDVVNAILSIPLDYLLLLLLIQFVIMLLSAIKWRLILRHSKISFKNLLASTFLGYLVNNITPIGLAGGEPVKAYTLAKTEGIPIEKSFASVLVDLFLEIFPIFLLSGIAIFLIILYRIPIEIAAILGIVASVLLIFFVLSITLVINEKFSLRIIELFIDVISRFSFLKDKAERLRSEIDDICARFHDAIRTHMLDNYTLFIGTLISISGWSLKLLRVYVIFIAVGIKIPISTLIIVEAVVIALSFIPILPGSLVIWEGTSIVLFVLLGAPVGVTLVKATTVTMSDRILFYLIPSILGVFGAVYLDINISKLVGEEIMDEKIDLEEISRIINS